MINALRNFWTSTTTGSSPIQTPVRPFLPPYPILSKSCSGQCYEWYRIYIDDATDATESIVLDDKIDRKSDDDDDSEFYLYKGPSAPFALRKFPRDINNNATTADEAKPAANDTTSTIDPIILPPVYPFCNQTTTHEKLMQFEELAVSNLIPHDSTYNDDDDSTNSDDFTDSDLGFQ